MPDSGPNKADVLAAARAQWPITEAAPTRCAPHFDRPTELDWNVGDVLRHVAMGVANAPSMVAAVIELGRLREDPTAQNTEGIAERADWTPEQLHNALRTGHEALLRVIEQLPDDLFARRIEAFGNVWFGDLLIALAAGHEGNHVDQALRGAGLEP
ncbi:MAG: maleylpyruvate isomerase N-terminal domain-containing protein [Dehalococcoidia bacterium]|nr:maleylpyruvate isomerase N-terminal domain-containing protein [Dehalococcoidia bacterium]